MNEDIVVPLAFFGMVIVLGLGVPIVRAMVRRWEHRPEPPPSFPDSDARLARIEQAIEAMSLEMERLAEGQRFVAKVLAERSAESAALPGAQGRVEQPNRTR